LILLLIILFINLQRNGEDSNDLPLDKGKITFNLHTPVAFLTKAVDVGDEEALMTK
jgi:hypothetical protein